MQITKNENNKITILLTDYPNTEQLYTLNSFNRGNYYVCEERGYKRLLVQSGEGRRYICMECPIKQKFTM